jgi:hypothetical protein
MRLREPFAGYKLSSGHFLFHMGFLLGSFLPMNYGVNETENLAEAAKVLLALRCAHVAVPICSLLSFFCKINEYYSVE